MTLVERLATVGLVFPAAASASIARKPEGDGSARAAFAP